MAFSTLAVSHSPHLTEDKRDACHIIANKNGGPCHTFNLDLGGAGANRSQRDKHDAENIYNLAGTATQGAGQPAVNAVWICLWCDKVKLREKRGEKAVEVKVVNSQTWATVSTPLANREGLFSENNFLASGA